MGIQSSWVYPSKHQSTKKQLSLSSPAQDNSAKREDIVKGGKEGIYPMDFKKHRDGKGANPRQHR
ncbi:hypothetical protein [Photorhabdus africana]|uniref:hypothetical protein n=1 Tax=Photorhabdus africana TaxID=3097554 RepID=UPI002B418387|nr:hypothetical protein [Photorhabdus sp. CRI-LC]